jgi:pantetheine-phosphate adenylyltransferase
LFAGSFDPVTLGHVDVVVRGAAVFEQVVVAVADNPAKNTWFTAEERVALFRASLPEGLSDRVEVVVVRGLLVHAAQQLKATVLLRGVRGPSDLDLELRNGVANRELSGLETLLLPTDPRFAHVSSSLVKEIARYGGDVTRYLSPPALQAVQQHLERAS